MNTRGMPSADTPIVALRRANLSKWIDAHYYGVQQSFVDETGINQGELSALLGKKRTKKSFGEKKARAIEIQAGMPTDYLDTPVDQVPAERPMIVSKGKEVESGAQSENDMSALQMTMRSLVKALAENIPVAAEAFANHLVAQAREAKFSTRRGVVAEVLGIVRQGRQKGAAARRK